MSFQEDYVRNKVDTWVKDIKSLAEIAIEEPQAALSAFTKGICHRWKFIQRTIPNTSHLFAPLEHCIRHTLIPSIIGREISDLERKMFTLPVRFGGLGIADPCETAEREYSASLTITEKLQSMIVTQDTDLDKLDVKWQEENIADLLTSKELYLTRKYTEVLNEISNAGMKKSLELCGEKGAGSWLTALPLKNAGFLLNKREFIDAICKRYGWNIPNTPPYCACGKKNDLNHTLICMKGGYVFLRHNDLVKINEDLQNEAECWDVTHEPKLMPLHSEEIADRITRTHADRAGPDIS